MKTYFVDTAVFGRCLLRPHMMADDPPTSSMALGYVDFGDDDDTLRVSIFQAGAWRDRNFRKWAKPVVRWYSMERADGFPVLAIASGYALEPVTGDSHASK